MVKDDAPILIFKGFVDPCYGVMRSFSDHLRDALVSLGEEVIYLDPNEDFLTTYANKRYKAVIGFMDRLFDNCAPGTDIPLFDLFYGPKFNYWTDHPIVFYHQMNNTPKDYYILTQDRGYSDFINTYYDKVVKAFYFPPGASESCGTVDKSSRLKKLEDREYDVSFVGSYTNWRGLLETNVLEGDMEILRDAYLDILLTQNSLTTEEALIRTLKSCGIEVSKDDLLKLLYRVRFLAAGVASGLFREKMIQTVLDAGIKVDVFGESWKESPFSENPLLVIHDSKNAGNGFDVYSNSKISLSIMAWHKDCITERVLDAMYAGSIVITDKTPALEEAFYAGQDILFFSLNNLRSIPDMIKKCMQDEELAQNGRNKVATDHSWEVRAKELLDIIQSIDISVS